MVHLKESVDLYCVHDTNRDLRGQWDWRILRRNGYDLEFNGGLGQMDAW